MIDPSSLTACPEYSPADEYEVQKMFHSLRTSHPDGGAPNTFFLLHALEPLCSEALMEETGSRISAEFDHAPVLIAASPAVFPGDVWIVCPDRRIFEVVSLSSQEHMQ